MGGSMSLENHFFYEFVLSNPKEMPNNTYMEFCKKCRAAPSWKQKYGRLSVPEQGKVLGALYRDYKASFRNHGKSAKGDDCDHFDAADQAGLRSQCCEDKYPRDIDAFLQCQAPPHRNRTKNRPLTEAHVIYNSPVWDRRIFKKN